MSRPIRVAHVVATVGATGVESYLLTLFAGFDRREVESVLFVPGAGVLVDRMRERGLSVEYGAPTRKLAFGEERPLARRLEGAFDIVHAHGARASFWAERAARRARIAAFVLTVHELRWQTYPPSLKRELWLLLEGGVLTRATRLITVSEASRHDLLARRPDLAGRTRVVHASAPLLLDARSLPRAAPGSGGEPLRLITVGRFRWEKGYDLLFEALGRLQGLGVPFALEVVGHGALEPELRSQVARLGLEGAIHWLGGEVDVPKRLASADAFVTATRAETFGIAVLEAMAIGLPVLAPAVGSLAEVIADGETGVLVPFRPERTLPDRFAQVLARWAADPGERARLGAAGIRRAQDQFGPAALARGVTEVYRDLVTPLEGRPPDPKLH